MQVAVQSHGMLLISKSELSKVPRILCNGDQLSQKFIILGII